ncbi:class I SAM-dependent methyltransferase [Priestia megaterium]|uniref:class I SAM-dependent methyltransferase n=1 Tax=Priestia megaterium TaxID=1404 RepID=UPI002DB6EC8A|nr:rRNA adenine N-6-methyltransferase family protein [Priestia megaterium]MEC1069225.1 rRNA adenine N-6-methyltransferase family protein [Priestia megaterium]
MNLAFMYQYFHQPRTVGALLPSSTHLAEKMVKGIDFEHADCIVEYGPGTGVFTRELVRRRSACTTLLLIEYNRHFYEKVKEQVRDEKNVYVIHGSAENVQKYLIQYDIPKVDYVLSGLPFASLASEVSECILQNTRSVLAKEGKFITFQYTNFKKQLIRSFFPHIKVEKEWRNVPPAYIFTCEKNQL